MPHHTVQTLIKDHAPYIKRANSEQRGISRNQAQGIYGSQEAYEIAAEHLSVALTCYDEIAEQAQMEINDLERELSVAEQQLVRALAKMQFSLWIANSVNRDELFKWLEEQDIELFFDIDHFSYMTGLAFNDEESMMLVKVKYGEFVIPSDDVKLIC